MLIDYVSSAMDENDFKELFKESPKMPGQQAQKYNRLMIEGLAANGVEVYAVSGRPVTRMNYQGKYLPKQTTQKAKISWKYGSVLNIPIIKNIWQMVSTYSTVYKDCKAKDSAVVIDVLNASIAYGAALAAKRRNRPCIGVVTDLPELMVTGTNRGHVWLVKTIMRNCTGFVFLTEAMNTVVNTEKKPHVIIEALCDINMQIAERKTGGDIKKCMYAGLLDARYGVKTLVEGFILADIPNAELHLFGDGPYVEELSETICKHNNVFYHGTVLNDVIVKEELEATLLINPRPTHESFTRYSFPSKNMEYMSTGTPVLTTKLPGMPDEYVPYVYLIEKEDVTGVADALKSVLMLPREELFAKGQSAKLFVLNNKNNQSQASALLSII